MEKDKELLEAIVNITSSQDLLPTADEFKNVLESKKFYEDNYADISVNPQNYRRGSK